MKRELTQEEMIEVVNFKDDEVGKKFLSDWFAVKGRGSTHPRFNTFDYFTLPAKFWYNDKAIKTTIGRFLWNKYALPVPFLERFGYQNATIDEGYLSKKIEAPLADMLLNDEITAEDYMQFMDRGEFILMQMAYYLMPSIGLDMITPLPEVVKLRDKLFDENKEALEAGDTNTAGKIEAQLVKFSKEQLAIAKHPARTYYDCGSFNFGNNYKKTSIMGGVIENPATKKLNVMKSNYTEGITKQEFQYFANLTVIGAYARGVATAEGGYSTKKYNSSMQTCVLDEAGTDCGTKLRLEIDLIPALAKTFLNRYITVHGQDILLTESNIGEYTGKKVQLRSPMYCKSVKPCNKCAGELYQKLGMLNVGLVSSAFSGSLMNLAMKKMHDSSIKFDKLGNGNIEQYIRKL